MSIQSSINQMLSSVANQQLFKVFTGKVKEIKTDTGNITEEQKRIKTDTENITKEQKRIKDLIQKHGSVQGLKDASDLGKQMIEEEDEARKKFPGFDDAVSGMTNILQQIKNRSDTRVKMQQILAEDTQDAVKERYEQSKGGKQK